MKRISGLRPCKQDILFLMFLAASLLLLTACGNKQKPYRIGVSQCSTDDWRLTLNTELEREALFHGNAEVEIRSANDNSEQQIADINYFLENKFDLLVVAPNVEADIKPAVDSAFKSGMPVLIVDRKLGGNNFTAFVGSDNVEIGRMAANCILRDIPANAPRQLVLEIAGLPGSTPARDRHNGFMQVIKDEQRISLLATHPANWDADNAERLMDSLLNVFPHIDYIYAHNDRMGQGARKSLERAGRQDQTKIVGVDALANDGGGVDMVIEGKFLASCFYEPGGDKVMQQAMAILQGQPFERELNLPSILIDSTNAHVVKMQHKKISEQDDKVATQSGRVNKYLQQVNMQRWLIEAAVTILALVILVLFVLLRFYWAIQGKNVQLEQRNNEIQRQKDELEENNNHLITMSRELERATHAKLMFFTNVSHDFRTPLTLIADPVDQLFANDGLEPLTPRQRSLLDIVKRNTDILLRLVGQILDFRRVENGKMPMGYAKTDLSLLMNKWVEQFIPAAEKRHINLTLDCLSLDRHNGTLPATIDVGKVERIMFNLIGNALKFTPENGAISVTLTLQDSETACISVADNGPGIDPEELPCLFDRFHQSESGMLYGGTGIGLALVKAFTEMHGGTISVESQLGKGSCFKVLLPLHGKADNQEAIEETEAAEKFVKTDNLENYIPSAPISPTTDSAKTTTQTDDADLPVALVIDDNADLRAYVADLLRGRYRLFTAADGREGLETAIREVPDIVICDVMMPVMDGLECCRQLKQHTATSHIPVLLLTANSLDEHRIQGYNSGADAYISKPFNSQLLITQMNNLIQNRLLLRSLFAVVQQEEHVTPVQQDPEEPETEKSNEIIINPVDRIFVERFLKVLDKHMSNAELSADFLASEMNLSRVQLYRKLKAITGKSINEQVRTARLERAQYLLLNTEKSISEIGYEVGFSAPSYFTKCYKEHFGHLPGDERQ